MKAQTPLCTTNQSEIIWKAFPGNRISIRQFIVIMEAYQSEFCGEDEFYNILETISPFAATMNEVIGA